MTQPYPNSTAVPWELLARHLAAEATVAERQTLRQWTLADPAHLQILTTVTQAWERAAEAARPRSCCQPMTWKRPGIVSVRVCRAWQKQWRPKQP